MASCTLDKLLDFENRENSLHEQDGGINVMSMGRNGSSLAWMTKIPSTEQDGGINVMSMGRNGSSLAWMTTKLEAGESQTAVSNRAPYIAVRVYISSSTTLEI